MGELYSFKKRKPIIGLNDWYSELNSESDDGLVRRFNAYRERNAGDVTVGSSDGRNGFFAYDDDMLTKDSALLLVIGLRFADFSQDA